jgi:F0F1-type ATP synthase membrane subunit b/b'
MLFLAFAESIQLFPDGTIFIHIGLILAMIWLLNRTFFRPINRVIETREKVKGGHGTEAENVLKKAGDKEAEYNKALLEARSQGYDLIEKEHAAAIADREKRLAATKSELSDQMANEKADIEQQTAAARSIIASEADAMAEKIASNILKA